MHGTAGLVYVCGMKTKVYVPETRGRLRRYHFDGMEVGESRRYQETSVPRIHSSIKHYLKSTQLPWRFRCYTDGEDTVVVRTE